MNNSERDFSCSSSSSSINSKDIPVKQTDFNSSIDSYSQLFNKNKNYFKTSSEISFNQEEDDDEQINENQLTTVNLNKTFTKQISSTLINIFTGKPISPNPWRKLCTKNIPSQIESDHTAPIPSDLTNKNLISATRQDQFISQTDPDLSLRDIRSSPTVLDNSNNDDHDGQVFEQKDKSNSIDNEDHYKSPLQRRRKKQNSLKDSFINESSSSDESIKKSSFNSPPKVNRLNDTNSSWYRLTDVYTSEDSDENNLPSKVSYSIRLRSDMFTYDESFNSSCSSLKRTDTRSTMTDDDLITHLNFLESLSDEVPLENKHPDAQPYFLQSAFQLKEKREQLANKLLSLYNQDVFSSQLSDKVSVVWSSRLTATAGYCTTRRNTQTAVITLSHKVCHSPERCRDTLLHEMCHAAVTLIDGMMEQGHGPLWQKWTSLAQQIYPYLPPISVRHNYDVMYKFIYRCIKCQYEVYRHSKSLNVAIDFCGKCMGQFELIINDKNDIDQEQRTPKKTINRYNLYVKENFQIIKQANPHLSTPQLMKQLSQEYKQKNQQHQKQIDLPDLDQLTI